jgi:NAD(P)-dependent dehydrogenase (short-subunit alcohol dehydrogenase family)
MRELRGGVAVVTGAGSGIGEGIARAAAAAGMRVVAGDIEQAAVERVAKGIEQRGGEAIGVHCDVTRRADLDALADAAWSRFGGCHLLCNNAGVLVRGPLPSMSDADWRWVLEVNLFGVVNGIQAFVPRMIAQRAPAQIVNTASVAGLCILPEHGVYTASKFAVVALSESLRADLAPHGIGVSVLCPGGVTTRIQESDRNRPDGVRAGLRTMAQQSQATIAAARAREEMLSPDRVGEIVLDAVRADEPWVITHPAWRPRVAERSDALLAGFDRAAQRVAN